MAEETFPGYVQRMAALGLSNEDLLARYAAGPAELEAALAGLTEEDLDLCRAEGKWTIRQYVHHVVNGDDVMCGAIQAALGKPGCSYSFEWYDHQGWVDRVMAEGAIEPGMALLRANRAYVTDLLQRVPDAWAQEARRAGTEPAPTVGESTKPGSFEHTFVVESIPTRQEPSPVPLAPDGNRVCDLSATSRATNPVSVTLGAAAPWFPAPVRWC